MATTQPQPQSTTRRQTAGTEGKGWLVYSGVLVLIAATLNIIWGIAAVDNANFFVGDAHYVISDLNLWGWVSIVVGLVLVAAGIGIFSRSGWAMWTGIAACSLNAVLQLMSIPAYPFWSIAVFALALLAMYGLVAYGRNP